MDFKNKQMMFHKISHICTFLHLLWGGGNERYLSTLSFLNFIYILKIFAHILMLAIAGRTAGPDWLKFLKKSIVTLGNDDRG